MIAARRAGYIADNTAISDSKKNDRNADVQVQSKPAKNGGIGNRFTNPQKPKATIKPIAPLRAATITLSAKN